MRTGKILRTASCHVLFVGSASSDFAWETRHVHGRAFDHMVTDDVRLQKLSPLQAGMPLGD